MAERRDPWSHTPSQRLQALDPGFQQVDPWHRTFAEHAEDL